MAKKMIKIAPSLLAANFKKLDYEIKRTIHAKADWLHLDIMDGVFVPNISFGMPICEAIQNYPIFKDVHLMIQSPQQYIQRFIDLKADLITFHFEAFKYKKDILNTLKLIKKNHCFCGMSIKPNTLIEEVYPYLKQLDVVLIMSVEPGFGGQQFNQIAIDKIKKLRKYIDDHLFDCLIEVDGGINDTTAKMVVEAGADVLVSGSYLYSNTNMKEKIKDLKKLSVSHS